MNDELRNRYASILNVSPENVSAEAIIRHLEGQLQAAQGEIAGFKEKEAARARADARAEVKAKVDGHVERGALPAVAGEQLLIQYDQAADADAMASVIEATLGALPDECIARKPVGTGKEPDDALTDVNDKAKAYETAYQARLDAGKEPAEALRETTAELGIEAYNAFADAETWTINENWNK